VFFIIDIWVIDYKYILIMKV